MGAVVLVNRQGLLVVLVKMVPKIVFVVLVLGETNSGPKTFSDVFKNTLPWPFFSTYNIGNLSIQSPSS